MDKPIEESYWVVPGVLLAGEYPRFIRDEESPARLARFVDAGVTSFIDLTEDGELSPYEQWLDVGRQRYRRFGIRDVDVPASEGLTEEILDAIDGEIASEIAVGGVVYVHCWGGVGRTGTIVGCWLARHGDVAEPGSALERLRRLWSDCSKSAWRDSPETSAQAEYVRGWDARCGGSSDG